MASEVVLSGGITYGPDANSLAADLIVTRLVQTSAGLKLIHAMQSVGITEEAVVLAEVTSIGWAMFINRDATNFIELRVATGGAKFAKLRPSGGFCLCYMGSGAQVPYAIADTAACLMEYLLVMQ